VLAVGCALKSRFWCTAQQKVRLSLAFLTPQKRPPPQSVFFKDTALEDGSERNKDRGQSDGPRWPAVLRCSVSRCNRRGVVGGGSGRGCSVRVIPLV